MSELTNGLPTIIFCHCPDWHDVNEPVETERMRAHMYEHGTAIVLHSLASAETLLETIATAVQASATVAAVEEVEKP